MKCGDNQKPTGQLTTDSQTGQPTMEVLDQRRSQRHLRIDQEH